MVDTVLVTGGMGCIGAWVLHHLVRQNIKAINFDLSQDRARLNLLLTPEQQEAITFVSGDLAQPGAVADVVAQHGVTRIIHLAALQVPFCRANPVLAAVHVVGTVNILSRAAEQHQAYRLGLVHSGVRRAEDYRRVAEDYSPLYPRTRLRRL